MLFLKNLPIIGSIFTKIIDIVGEVVPDKDLQLKIKTKLSEKIADADAEVAVVVLRPGRRGSDRLPPGPRPRRFQSKA